MKFVLAIWLTLVAATSITTFVISMQIREDINRYKIPFMKLAVDLSRSGRTTGWMDKKFDPEVAIAVCLVPDTELDIPSSRIACVSGHMSVADVAGFVVMTNMFSFTRGFSLPSGRVVYCVHVPPKSFPVGRYKFTLDITTGALSMMNVKHHIEAYPVSEFLPMKMHVATAAGLVSVLIFCVTCYRIIVTDHNVTVRGVRIKPV